jgi:hypothetical protein
MRGGMVTSSTAAATGASGSKGEGEHCEASAECGSGLACFDRGGGATECGKVCCPGDNTCSNAQGCTCMPLVGEQEAVWGRCMDAQCNVLDPVASCSEGFACYVTSADGATTCLTPGSVGSGGACVEANNCAPGLFCAGLNPAARRCRRICGLGGQAPLCAEGEGHCEAQTYLRGTGLAGTGPGLCTGS